MENNANSALFNILVTHDFDPEILDSAGKSVTDPSQAEMFSFDYTGPSGKNYGTVVILLDNENKLTVFSGDNIGKTMDFEDKQAWFGTETQPGFLQQMKSFAVTNNLGKFNVENISRLKYTMQGMAAIKEGLFEGYYGKKNISYSDQPMEARLMIKHSRDIKEGEARFRAIESLFVETADGSRYKLPHRNLMCGKAMARHCSEGGNPYDAFGQYINGMVAEMNTLGRFIRAARHKNLNDDAHGMLESAVRHYSELKDKAKHMISRRGYLETRDAFDPAEISAKDHAVESIRDLFIETMLDQRIEEALPLLAKLKETNMKEANEFESWADQVMEGTWSLPDTPEAEQQLQTLMSKPLVVGADATNATEQLYDLIGDDILFDRLGDLADRDPDANCWEDPGVIDRLGELGIDISATVGPEAGDQEVKEGSMKNQMHDDAERMTREQFCDKYGDENGEFWDNIMGDDEELSEGSEDNPVASSITRRILMQRADLLSKYGPVAVTQAIDDVADFVGDVDEIGSSDVSGWIRQVEQQLGSMNQGMGEDLDTDGVMMTKPSNMSSESIDPVSRLKQMIKY